MKGKEYKKTFNDVQNEFRLISSAEAVFSKWKRVISDHESGDLICPENGVPFKTLDGWSGNEGLTHEFFKILAALSEDEMDDLAAYILNERPTRSAATREAPKVTVKTLPVRLRGRGIYSAKEWAERKKNKKIILQVVDQLSANKHKLTYDDDGTTVVRVKNWKEFKLGWSVSSATMNLWFEAAGSDFLKGKLQRKNKNKEAPPELQSQITHLLEHRAAKPVGDRVIQFCPIERHKFLKFVDKDGAKGFSRQEIRRGDTPFGCGLIDFRNISSIVAGSSLDCPFYKDFLAGFETFRLPAYLECPVWIWITDSKRKEQVNRLLDARRMDFRVVESVYIPHRLEQHVYNEDPGNVEGSNITVYILILKSHGATIRVPSSFLPPDMTDYQESTFAGSLVELRMEFYIKVLQMLVLPGHALFNILGGKKAMLAAQVILQSSHAIVLTS